MAWVPVALCMALIFSLSSRSDPTGSSGVIEAIYPLPDWTIQWVYHGAAFGILSLLTYFALDTAFRFPWPICILLSLAVTVGYGFTDEWVQSTVPGRSSSLADVAKDTVGATFFIAAARAIIVSINLARIRKWQAFLRLYLSTLIVLQGFLVVWLTSLWMAAGTENSFSLYALTPNVIDGSLIDHPLSAIAAIPFLIAAGWIASGFARSSLDKIGIAAGPSLTTFILLAGIFIVYVLDAAPDRGRVWVGIWVVAGGGWAGTAWLMSLVLVAKDSHSPRMLKS